MNDKYENFKRFKNSGEITLKNNQRYGYDNVTGYRFNPSDNTFELWYSTNDGSKYTFKVDASEVKELTIRNMVVISSF